MGEIAMNCN